MKMELCVMAGAALLASGYALQARRRSFVVPDGHYGLLYRDGEYLHRISPGKHQFWSRAFTVRLIDMRRLSLEVDCEDVQTADNVRLHISAVLSYQIIHAEKAVHDVADYLAFLRNSLQLAIQFAVGAMPAESVMNRHTEVGKQLFALVQPQADRIGIVIRALDLKEAGIKSPTGKGGNVTTD